ncbi:MAG: sulfatase [Myxococcota bacterium]|nr:sulfatase [Myxococcota bacterium]
MWTKNERPERWLPWGVPLLAAIMVWFPLGACDSAPDRPLDLTCGNQESFELKQGFRLERDVGRERLFTPVRTRRHSIENRPRDTVSGFREIKLFERELEISPRQRRHDEIVPARLDLSLESNLLFAPRYRQAGETEWIELGWLEVAADRVGTGDAEELVYSVPFDFTGIDPHIEQIEIGLSAYVSSTKKSHAWETEPRVFEEEDVLLVDLGRIAAAPADTSVAWRLLACEGERCRCLFSEVSGTEGKPAGSLWQQRWVDLGGLAESEAVLHFETEVLSGPEGAADPGLWAEPVIFRRSQGASDPPRPNLLIVSLDTLGADHLGLYGYPRKTSPFIDDVLAPEGTTFLRALAPATTTSPSHMTLLTATPPSIHGVVSNLGGRSLPQSIPTLAETLQASGYMTAAITENGAITRALGFGRGFDHYEENLSARILRPEGHIEATFSAGREFSERMEALPWFVFVQTYQVHYPYTPPSDYDHLFEDDGLDPPSVVAQFGRRPRGPYHPILYDREIRYADDQLRVLIESLDQDGLLENTVVVILADHGEAFFEHTYIGHGSDLHRETVRVPLIFVGPGIPQGRRIEQPVGLADVMPTVLDLLGVPIPPQVKGQSLVPLFSGPPVDEDRPIFSEAWQITGVTRKGGVELDQPTYGVERGRYKLIRYPESEGFRYAFFDLVSDPDENQNLLEIADPLDAQSARQFDTLSTLLADYVEVNKRLAEELDVQPDTTPETEIDPERLEKLRALGYVE